MQTLVYTLSFVLICLASHRVGQFFTRIKLPYITGYLFLGALVASFGLDWIPSGASESLRFIDQMALAVIAFVAGSELYLKDLRRRLHTILWTTGGILVATWLLLGIALFLLTQSIAFTADWPTVKRLAVAMLGATVLLALSPPSTIAVIKEVRARGPFTQAALGVTVLMDVVIIVLFAVITSLASTLLTGSDFSAAFLALLALDLALALGLGYVVGRVLDGLLQTRLPALGKIVAIVLLGYGIFVLADQVKTLSTAYLGFEVYIEPLLIALVGGFFVTNFTAHRQQFDGLLHDVGPVVYVAFFTLTGISLKLDILWATLPVALALFLVRMGGIALGAYLGGAVAGTEARQRRFSWMAFITQAGIALGLAREVAVQFPALGDAFATLIISVVVLNEVFGPLFLKAALRWSGETNLPEVEDRNEERRAVILGIEPQTEALAETLQTQGWQIQLADIDSSRVEAAQARGLPARALDGLSRESLTLAFPEPLDAWVAMLPDDSLNERACRIAYEHLGAQRLIVRLNKMTNAAAFRELGAFVVDTTSAMINLIDQAVRAPRSAALLMHQDATRDLVQVTMRNADLDGLPLRDLRLPPGVLLLDIARQGSRLLPHGHTLLRLRDEITLIGTPEDLEAVTLRLGY